MKDFMQKTVYALIVLSLLTTLAACGRKKPVKAEKELRVEITGLDGNGFAEKRIGNALREQDGVIRCAFNYLEDEVIVTFDTTKIAASRIIAVIEGLDDGKYKIINHQQQEVIPQRRENDGIAPDGKEIGDDVDTYDDAV